MFFLFLFKHENYFYFNFSDSPDKSDLSEIASIFFPRMNFDQWKPLTGRGDPLHNDPTYDYEPPVLEKVHYWVEDSRPEREKYPERKSEVLVLGVSSRKPSVASRQAPPIKRHPKPPSFGMKYEDFSYKFSDHYPMTILVPPPPPPPLGHKLNSFILPEVTSTLPSAAYEPTRDTTIGPEIITTYALQEANLIYQSSTLKQNWLDYNKTINLPNNTVSSDYAGWGPTTPFEEINDSHNIISHIDSNNFKFTKDPLSFYKPVLSEAPPPPILPPQDLYKSVSIPNFLPTVLPPTLSTDSKTKEMNIFKETIQPEIITDHNVESTTEKKHTPSFYTAPLFTPKPNVIGMLGPMISMPMVTDPDRPEDNLYAHASDNIHIFKDPEKNVNLEMMQTMQPPPPVLPMKNTPVPHNQYFNVNPHHLNGLLHENPAAHTHDPYLHMRFTTPMSTKVSAVNDKEVIEPNSSNLIIQGHSKVKTYGSKPKPNSKVSDSKENSNQTHEVRHLHPIKEKPDKMSEKSATNRESRSQNLKSLIETGLGSIEIQEADVGIKYDVSDGSEVPVELYRKGIVESEENNYQSFKRNDIDRKLIF